jgi:hypothetical protein
MTPAEQRQGERTPLLILDLFRAGFTTEQILRLQSLRAGYQPIEHLTSRERTRLWLLKYAMEQRSTAE